MTLFYVDASVVGHALLADGDPRASAWLNQASRDGCHLISSRLIRLELTRLARREGLALSWVAEAAARLDLVTLDEAALGQAEGIEQHVKSLDAIHLGTALSVDPALTVVSHDGVMLRVADELGFPTLDPLAAASDPDP
ncbi:MAG: PIN domain-containing protein [Propionibacteriaceae bacterium]|jgi:predicted nucleic acid-binding protein|nr:PIN domain-containing protein [Propionibacteriaceae bacterium]